MKTKITYRFEEKDFTRIQEILKSQDISISQLASFLNVSKQYLSQVFHGQKNITKNLRYKLKFYGINYFDFIGA